MKPFRPTTAEIDLDALEFNIGLISKNLPNAFLCPMVKSNAYGHGDILVAKTLELMGLKQMGVCLLEEGLRLRQAGIKTDILVFQGCDRAGLAEALRQRLTPVLTDFAQIEELEAIAQHPVDVHVKFDTGMNRLGFSVDQAGKVAERLALKNMIRLRGIATHLVQGADANQEDGVSVRQLKSLRQAAAAFNKTPEIILHALNSAGIVRRIHGAAGELKSENWGLRPGLMIYGAEPLADFKFGLKPVMTLKSEVMTFRNLYRGETVSYNGTWRAQRESVIGVVPIGYGDGYHRTLSNKAEVLFAGQRTPVVGTVCMDYIMIDVTDVARTSDSSARRDVILFGDALSADELAQKAGTISYEIFTSVGPRVPRVALGRRAQAINAEAAS